MTRLTTPQKRNKEGLQSNTRHVEYETEERHYVTSTVRTPDYIKNMITVAAHGRRYYRSCCHRRCNGPNQRAHLVGSPGWCTHTVVFINKTDQVDDPELIELVEEEMRDSSVSTALMVRILPLLKVQLLRLVENMDDPEKVKPIQDPRCNGLFIPLPSVMLTDLPDAH